jgi:hypothetical protein
MSDHFDAPGLKPLNMVSTSASNSPTTLLRNANLPLDDVL